MPPVGMRHGIKNIIKMLFSGDTAEDVAIQTKLINFRHLIAFDSGKAALLAGLRVMAKIKADRNEVIIPAYTCFSVAAVIENAGLRLVLCDILPETLDFDYEMLSGLMSERTLCVMPTHLFGKSADVGRVKSLAVHYGSYVIEDSAQSLPEKGDSSHADIAIFSFGRGKPLSAGGGGGLASNQEAIIKAIQSESVSDADNSFLARISIILGLLLNDFLISPYIYRLPASLPFLKIGKTIYPDDVAIASMPKCKTRLINNLVCKYDELSRSRHEKSQFYCRSFGLPDNLNRITHLGQSYYRPIRHPFYLSGSVSSLPDRVVSRMRVLGVVRMYPCGLHKLKEVQGFWVNKMTTFPGTDWVSEHLLSLPVHSLVKKQDQIRVVEYLKNCVMK